jgi:dihydroorotase
MIDFMSTRWSDSHFSNTHDLIRVMAFSVNAALTRLGRRAIVEGQDFLSIFSSGTMVIELNAPLDMHLHLREGAMLDLVGPLTAQDFAAAVIMPNLIKPVDSRERLRAYTDAVQRACGNHFTPYMTLYFRPYSMDELLAVKDEIIGIKLYPAGVTTGSEAGVADFTTIRPTLAAMEELKIPLLVHGETHGFVMDREREFLVVYEQIVGDFPDLHLIMEHITTAEAVSFLDSHEKVSATVTLHHLLITLDDLAGGLLEPDLFCKPIAKTPKDRQALCEAVLAGHPQIMFGSDSAPHPRNKKECCGCAAGIFTAPVALPLLVEFFGEAGCLDKLQAFVSDIACRRYGIAPPKRKTLLREERWRVPQRYGEVRPFAAGRELHWKTSSAGVNQRGHESDHKPR